MLGREGPAGATNAGTVGIRIVAEAKRVSKVPCCYTKLMTTLFTSQENLEKQDRDVHKKLLLETLVCLLTTENDSA